jgi:hypothetical protein
MANADTPFGLRPVRYRNGSPWNGAATPYHKAAGTNEAWYIGDAVVKNGAGNAASVQRPGLGNFPIGTLSGAVLATAGDTNPITGVVVAFGANPDALGRIYSPVLTEDIAWVVDDPNVIFEIQADGAIPAASVGLNAVLIKTHAGSTVTGRSGTELDTTSDTPAADASNQLLILRAVNRDDNDTTLAHAKVEVLINLHTEKSTGDGDGMLGVA